jgi:hypothetical protein
MERAVLPWEGPMSWIVIATGLGGAALVAMGSDLIMPIGYGIGSFLDLAGVASMMVSFSLADGA